MNAEDGSLEKLDFISEKYTTRSVRIGFVPRTEFEDFERKISKLVEYAVTKQQEEDKKRVYLCFDSCFEDKWELICKTLSIFIDQLPNIDVLDVQHSDFPLIALYQLYELYSKYEKMENLPTICIVDTFAHEESDTIIELCRTKQKGQNFLQKLYFPENKYFEKSSNP